MESYRRSIRSVVQEITNQVLQLHPKVMLLFDFGDCRHKDLLANMLTAGIAVLVQKRQTARIPHVREWMLKVCYVCLLNKLSAVCRYRLGNTNALPNIQLQWKVFIWSSYLNAQTVTVKECVLQLL